MTRNKRLFLLIVLIFFNTSVFSQEDNTYKLSSVEISSGIPPIFGLIASNGIMVFPEELGKDSGGIVERNHHAQQLNIAFNWDRNRRWDFVAMAGITTGTYSIYQYRSWVSVMENGYDNGYWEGGPDLKQKKFELCNGYLSGFARVKYAYMKHAHLYSAFGVGIDIAMLTNYLPIMPYISPIGISIGETSKVYGFFETTLGTGGTLILAGLGVRL